MDSQVAAVLERAADLVAVSPKFTAWNSFLSAELGNKGREVLATLGPNYSSWQEKLGSHPFLTDRERDLSQRVDVSKLESLVLAGLKTLDEEELPERFQEATGTSPGLFAQGDTTFFDQPCVAIIGTRGATTYGKACAIKFAEALASQGVTIISGGAMGIDTAAHEGALAVGGNTVAVLPCGIDVAYPAVNSNLFDRIRSQGCLISQFGLGRKAQFHSPLVRNVTVSALSHAVVVIEAPGKSGSIHTASQAGEMGREVFVVPGPIDRPSFIGSHNLVRDGATLVWHPDQVLEALGLNRAKKKKAPVLAGDAGTILATLTGDALPAERIVELTGLDAHIVLSELTMLEIEGRVFRDAGGYSLVL